MDKTWKVMVTYRSSQERHEVYHVKAETLYDAFIKYYRLYGTKHLVEIQITEVKDNE